MNLKTAKEHTFCCGIFRYKQEEDRMSLQQTEDDDEPITNSPFIDNLYYHEKLAVIVLFVGHRTLQLLCAI